MYVYRLSEGTLTLTNSVDPDQTPHNTASGQGLHSFHQMQEFLLKSVYLNTPDTPLN